MPTANLTQRQTQQQHLRKILDNVSLSLTMPPHAILVVRSLPDPAPGSLLAANRWQGCHGWQRATQQALNDCWRKALRPARSPIPAHANSVWFVDEAEWLACLSRDLGLGVAGDRWWWTTALRRSMHRSGTEAIADRWRESIQWLPAMMPLLFDLDRSVFTAILTKLSSSQARQLIDQLAQVYQCSLPQIISQDLDVLQLSVSSRIQAILHRLPQDNQALLAVCLTLPHTAQILRRADVSTGHADPSSEMSTQPSLKKTAMRLIENRSQTTDTLRSPPQDHEAIHESSGLETRLESDPTQPTAFAHPSLEEQSSSETLPILEIPTQTADTSDFSRGNRPPSSPITGNHDAIDLDPTPNVDVGRDNDPPILSIKPTQSSTALYQDSNLDANLDSTSEISNPHLGQTHLFLSDAALAAERGISTALGGLWYLVNLLVALDWPGRSPLFTPWHQLLALAQVLRPDYPPDPTWELLAAIAGEPPPANLLQSWQAAIHRQTLTYLEGRLEQPAAIADYILEPAILYLTRTHIDVVFSLDQIRLDLRMAGLDQDPGWVPELARAIAFHYE
ncbi:MAG TPA: hypothetical protein V6D20_20190 [Candidatus Obscuribacterales bacterium]